MATYYFEQIESCTISAGYTTIVIENHQAEIPPLKVTKIIDGKEVTEEIEDVEAILLAEKNGGVLPVRSIPKQRKPESKEGE